MHVVGRGGCRYGIEYGSCDTPTSNSTEGMIGVGQCGIQFDSFDTTSLSHDQECRGWFLPDSSAAFGFTEERCETLICREDAFNQRNYTDLLEAGYCQCRTDCEAISDLDNWRRAYVWVGLFFGLWCVVPRVCAQPFWPACCPALLARVSYSTFGLLSSSTFGLSHVWPCGCSLATRSSRLSL
jgi:hypothetical protein